MLPTSADVEDELTNDSLSSGGVCDFWVELDTIDRFGIMRQGRIWGSGRVSNDMKIRRRLR